MSRIGNKPIAIPKGVEVNIKDHQVVAKGPKGEVSQPFHKDMSVIIESGQVKVSRSTNERLHRALHGLTRSLIANTIEGVSKGFSKSLEIVGVGYRAQVQDGKLVIQIGFSHPVEIVPPPTISFLVEGANRITVQGMDKQLVGQIAAQIRRIRPPDSYKGKGLRYTGERVRLKAGKASARKK
ncbi:MAG: 50S ribosomal protein L6 [Chloroflexi bacterium]|nr:50S ribosomal protein L6 [Chloroflexota bacterium]